MSTSLHRAILCTFQHLRDYRSLLLETFFPKNQGHVLLKLRGLIQHNLVLFQNKMSRNYISLIESNYDIF